MDWLFMMGLLGVGVALILGVAIRPAAFSGALLLLMWAIFGLIPVGALATWGAGYLGRRWASLAVVESHPWLR